MGQTDNLKEKGTVAVRSDSQPLTSARVLARRVSGEQFALSKWIASVGFDPEGSSRLFDSEYIPAPGPLGPNAARIPAPPPGDGAGQPAAATSAVSATAIKSKPEHYDV
jgi:hypothetical protein